MSVDNSRRQRRRVHQSAIRSSKAEIEALGDRRWSGVSVFLVNIAAVPQADWFEPVADRHVTQYISRCKTNIALGARMTATEYVGIVDELAAAIAAGA